MKDVSLYAKPGQKIAFVGSTGAGKTTITNLINRFYEVPDGKIRYDGINIRKIKKDDLRRSLGMVLQDTHLFTGTVFENIRYGKLDATREEVIAAARLANADSFITRLPQGYDTVLTSDGSNLSQGQRQLLAIARAAVADPPVLILDEATSSIDTRTEALIEKGMDRLMEGRTVFVIAHRLSTVRNADAIMVLENGEIIERGSHDELISQKGKYISFIPGQFELDWKKTCQCGDPALARLILLFEGRDLLECLCPFNGAKLAGLVFLRAFSVMEYRIIPDKIQLRRFKPV